MNQKRLFLGAGIAAILLIGMAAWYFLYFTKTPSYSLRLVQGAIQKHDVTMFKKHVDLDSLLSRGLDDFIAFSLDQDETMDAGSKAMAREFFSSLLKEPTTNIFKDSALRYVESGKWNVAQDDDEGPISTDEISGKMGFKSASFKGVAYTKKDGKAATVGLNIFDENLNGNIVLEVRMRKLDDGAWQITELSNLRDYMDMVMQAEWDALKKYSADTKPMVSKFREKMAESHSESMKMFGGKSVFAMSESEKKQLKKINENRLANTASYLKELGTVKIPPAAVEIHDLRLKSENLRAQLFKKVIEFCDTGNQQLIVEAADMDKQLTSEVEKIKKHLAEADKH